MKELLENIIAFTGAESDEERHYFWMRCNEETASLTGEENGLVDVLLENIAALKRV